MIKHNTNYYIQNAESGEREDIIVTSNMPCSIKNLLLGFGLVIAGVSHIAISSFKYGANKVPEAEGKIFKSLKLIPEDREQ